MTERTGVNITAPNSEQIKHAMFCKFPVEHDGIRYARITGYGMYMRNIAGKDMAIMQVELKSEKGNSVTTANPKKITILNYWE